MIEPKRSPGISAEQWRLIEPLLDGALDLPPNERESFVEGVTLRDAALGAELARLLADDTGAEQFFTGAAAERFPGLFEAELPGVLGERFAIVREIGRGGMATVYIARDSKHDRDVALKVLGPEVAVAIGVERFLREIRVAAQLQHAHIVPLYDSGDDRGWLYYVMPVMNGKSLRDRIERDGPLPLDVTLRIAREIGGALEYAHHRGLIHRDVKPENILFDGERAVLADFGIARAVGGDGPTIGLRTATGISIGTPGYMSPEQATADAGIDARSDVYSLACVVHEMLTNSRRSRATAESAATSLTTLRPDVPRPVVDAIRVALAENPDDRFASAEEFVRAFDPADRLTAALGKSPVVLPWRRIALVAAGVVALGGAAAVLALRDRQVPAPPPAVRAARLGPRSVVVVPFDNSSPDKDNEYFADGVTDELIGALIRVHGLRVTSRSTSFAFKGTRLAARAIGDSLGVQMILSGGVRKAGNQLRIITQLTRATDDSAIWSKTYDRELSDVFKIQEELAQSIVAALQAAIGGAEIGSGRDSAGVQLVHHTTADREAYLLYLRGRFFWNRRTPDGFRLGAEYFDKAIARDSMFAAAWAGKADSYCILANFGIRPAREVCPLAATAARRAIQLDSRLAEAHASLGFVNLFFSWNFDEADRELKKAIALDSTYANAYLWLHHLATARGDTAAMLAYMRRALTLEPLSLIINARMASALGRAGKLMEAEVQVRRTVEMDSSFAEARAYLAGLLIDEGKIADGIAETQRVGGKELLAYAYARVGRRSEAILLTRQLEASRSRGEWISPLSLAGLYAELGDADSAFAWLDRAYEARDPNMIFLAYDGFGKLTGDARFGAMLRKIGLPARPAVR